MLMAPYTGVLCVFYADRELNSRSPPYPSRPIACFTFLPSSPQPTNCILFSRPIACLIVTSSTTIACFIATLWHIAWLIATSSPTRHNLAHSHLFFKAHSLAHSHLSRRIAWLIATSSSRHIAWLVATSSSRHIAGLLATSPQGT